MSGEVAVIRLHDLGGPATFIALLSQFSRCATQFSRQRPARGDHDGSSDKSVLSMALATQDWFNDTVCLRGMQTVCPLQYSIGRRYGADRLTNQPNPQLPAENDMFSLSTLSRYIAELTPSMITMHVIPRLHINGPLRGFRDMPRSSAHITNTPRDISRLLQAPALPLLSSPLSSSDNSCRQAHLTNAPPVSHPRGVAHCRQTCESR